MTHVTPLDPPLGLRKFWQDLTWSAEPDRGGKGSVKECRARLGRPWQIMIGPGMDWRCTGQGKAWLGRTWLGREGLVLVCQQNRGSQDRHRPVLRIGVLLVYVVYLDIKCLSLPYPVLPGFPVPAPICHGLSVPNLPYPVWLCTVQYCPSRRPCPVLLTTPDPVRYCPALLNID